MMQVPCELPRKSIFAPNLNVKVYDVRMLGDAQVGSSSFPVAPYIKWSDAPEVEPDFGEEPMEAVEEEVQGGLSIYGNNDYTRYELRRRYTLTVPCACVDRMLTPLPLVCS
jgi:hypothetical protein